MEQSNMTLSEFKNKYLGIGIDTDGSFGNQCMDLMHKYISDVLNLPDPGILAAPSALLAYQNFNRPDLFTKIVNTPNGIPDTGDIIFFGTAIGPYGHVAVVEEATVKQLKLLEQNWNNVQKVTERTTNYNGVLGWLHPKAVTVPSSPNSPIEAPEIKKWGDYTTALKKLNDKGRYNYYTDEPGRIVDDLIDHEEEITHLQYNAREQEQANLLEVRQLTDEIASQKTTISRLSEELLKATQDCNDKLDAQKDNYEKEMEANVNKSIALARKMADGAFEEIGQIKALPYFDTYQKAAMFIKSLKLKK